MAKKRRATQSLFDPRAATCRIAAALKPSPCRMLPNPDKTDIRSHSRELRAISLSEQKNFRSVLFHGRDLGEGSQLDIAQVLGVPSALRNVEETSAN
jgi:hypothetical protein